MLYGVITIHQEISNINNITSNHYRKLYRRMVISEVIHKEKRKLEILKKELKRIEKLSSF
jgi:murein L,D-transpeptidase YafK